MTAFDPPEALPLLSKEDKDLLAIWVRKDNASRSRDALLKEAGISQIDRAEALCDWLLQAGWIGRKEKLQDGSWHCESLTWRDLDRLKSLIVAALWRDHGQVWEPYRMGISEWQAASQQWPLNAHDVALLERLFRDENLPRELEGLGRAMLAEGRKAEQEGWL